MSQVRCPYCSSVQVKAMANQPKKYPRPTDPSALLNWQRGYDCKKCGNDFVITPPKPMGFFTKLIGFLLLAVIAFFVFAAIITPNKKGSTAIEQPQPTESQTTKDSSPTPQDFSLEAEEAAHAYTPTEEDYKKHDESIENSQNSDDTLNISITQRESE